MKHLTTTQDLATTLKPVAPPRVIDGVYRDNEYSRMVDVVKQNGPWKSIIANHFKSVDELIATITGNIAPDHGLTLDDIASAHFRGFFTKNSVCFYPELEDVYYDGGSCPRSSPIGMPNTQADAHALQHLRTAQHRVGTAPRRRHLPGGPHENTPVWLQNMMGKSGLFTAYLIKMAQIIAWWYLGEPGGFTYWPDGPYGPPQNLEMPMWNRGVVVQNEMMFHHGDPVGPPEDRAIEGLKNRSMFGYDEPDDSWTIRTDGEVIKRYKPEQIRLLVHWNAEVYTDMAEVEKVMDHSDDLTHDRVVDTFLADLRARGVKVAEPTEPLQDVDFMQTLMNTYDVAPAQDWITEPGF